MTQAVHTPEERADIVARIRDLMAKGLPQYKAGAAFGLTKQRTSLYLNWEKQAKPPRCRKQRAIAQASYRERHPERIQEIRRRYYEANQSKYREWHRRIDPALKAAYRERYRAAKIGATPPWLTREHMRQIQEIHREAVATGQHVDHIDPLVAKRKIGGKWMHVACGLHVPWNLQVLPKSENHSKSCFWYD